jgi:hypothetical protein
MDVLLLQLDQTAAENNLYYCIKPNFLTTGCKIDTDSSVAFDITMALL